MFAGHLVPSRHPLAPALTSGEALAGLLRLLAGGHVDAGTAPVLLQEHGGPLMGADLRRSGGRESMRWVSCSVPTLTRAGEARRREGNAPTSYLFLLFLLSSSALRASRKSVMQSTWWSRRHDSTVQLTSVEERRAGGEGYGPCAGEPAGCRYSASPGPRPTFNVLFLVGVDVEAAAGAEERRGRGTCGGGAGRQEGFRARPAQRPCHAILRHHRARRNR